jgi:L-cysteine S-thiosulfotransferase
MNIYLRLSLALGLLLTGVAVAAGDGDENMFAEYRAMFGDDNPAELVEMQGEELWNAARGPKQATLAACDFGLGAGVIAGVYAQLPRYFADTDQVMDLESRLLYCMETLQGMDVSALRQHPYSEQGTPQTDLETLSAYIAAQSRGLPVAVPQTHPQEQQAFADGARMFNFRGGPHDFSCATCHGQTGKRIRLQALPQLNTPEGARTSFGTWPAYRISQGAVRTIEWRMADCIRQQRLPGLVLGSKVAIDLITYLGVQANGAEMTAPGLKR